MKLKRSDMSIATQDFLEKLTIKFDNKEPVEVMGFLKSIHAFQKEYKSVCKINNVNYNDDEVKLYIQVREGCIEWDFIRKIINNHPVITGMVITPTVYLIKKTAEIIIDKVINKVISGEKVDDVSKGTLSNSKDFLAVQKNDSGSNLQIIYTAPSNTTPVTFNNCIFNGITARGVMDTIDDMLCKDKDQISDFNNEVLQLTCTKDNQIRGVVAVVDEHDKAIVFNPKELQNSLIINNKENPLSVCYLVNGKIKRNIDNKVIAYVVEELVEIIKD